MAPVDRREHRQQRMRGTGSTAIETAFAFNIGALVPPTKQASLPPQPSRQTPTLSTPKATNDSARRHRSVSVQRSSVAKKQPTPQQKAITPQSRKRKRSANNVTSPDVDDGLPDPLSPDIGSNGHSIQKSRSIPGPTAAVSEGVDPMDDELSMNGNLGGSEPRASGSTVVVHETPLPSISQDSNPIFTGSSPKLTSIDNRTENASIISSSQEHVQTARHSPRNAISAELGPPNPADALDHQKRHMSHSPGATPAMHNGAEVDNHSEDELSPLHAKEHSKVQARSIVASQKTPTVHPSRKKTMPSSPPNDDGDIDPLSPLAQSSKNGPDLKPSVPRPTHSTPDKFVPPKGARSRQRPQILDEEDVTQLSPPSDTPKQTSKERATNIREADPGEIDELSPDHKSNHRGRKQTGQRKSYTAATSSKHVDPGQPERAAEAPEIDELSPDHRDNKRGRRQMGKKKPYAPVTSSRLVEHEQPGEEAEDAVDDDHEEVEEGIEESDEERAVEVVAPQPRSQPKLPKKSHLEPSEEPPKKRQKLGPTQKITVMRLKGFGLSGMTVVDTTRSAVETLLNNQMIKLTTKMETTADPQKQRELRSQRNIILAYRDNLDDSFLELQDANNSAVDNANKLRQHKKDKKRLQKEFLALQSERDQLELQSDELAANFQSDKKETEDRHKLSTWMYDIQSAIKRGKDRARKQGRDNEGPEIPIRMLLDRVARDVSGSDGLLGFVKKLNGVLERSAGVLEGRA